MKISIITPTFNSARYIKETIDSIQQQSYTNFEHIIVDGDSKDDTMEIIRSYQGIQFLSERDTGQSNAINKGLRMATGDILAWQNADDLYSKDTFKIVVDYFNDNPSVDIVYGNYQLIDSESKWICNVYPIEWNKWMFSHGRFCPLQPTVFWRKKVSDQVGLLNESLHYCMDVDFFSRIVNEGFTFSRISEILGQFRVHTLSKTQNKLNESKVAREYKDVLAANFDFKFIDNVAFTFFQWRSRFAKTIKQKFLKKM